MYNFIRTYIFPASPNLLSYRRALPSPSSGACYRRTPRAPDRFRCKIISPEVSRIFDSVRKSRNDIG